jgi:hypothetical protein
MGDQIVGGIVTVALGVIVIAAIYQLGHTNNPIVPDATSLGQTTLTNLFK